jgi:hypothetical protein
VPGIGVADVGRASTFYDAALGALGLRRVNQLPEDSGIDGVGYGADYPVFWIDRFHPPGVKQQSSTPLSSLEASPRSMPLTPPLKAGGTDNGAPSLRENQSTPVYYAAFVFDPDGNNMEAVFRGGQDKERDAGQ